MRRTTIEQRSQEHTAGYQFIQDMTARADAERDCAPLWHGWALREAFIAGAKYQRELPLKPSPARRAARGGKG